MPEIYSFWSDKAKKSASGIFVPTVVAAGIGGAISTLAQGYVTGLIVAICLLVPPITSIQDWLTIICKRRQRIEIEGDRIRYYYGKGKPIQDRAINDVRSLAVANSFPSKANYRVWFDGFTSIEFDETIENRDRLVSRIESLTGQKFEPSRDPLTITFDSQPSRKNWFQILWVMLIVTLGLALGAQAADGISRTLWMGAVIGIALLMQIPVYYIFANPNQRIEFTPEGIRYFAGKPSPKWAFAYADVIKLTANGTHHIIWLKNSKTVEIDPTFPCRATLPNLIENRTGKQFERVVPEE